MTESLNRNRQAKDVSFVQKFKSYNLQKEWESLKYVHTNVIFLNFPTCINLLKSHRNLIKEVLQ